MTCRSSGLQAQLTLACLCLLLGLLLSFNPLIASENKSIKLAGTHWCPYSRLRPLPRLRHPIHHCPHGETRLYRLR